MALQLDTLEEIGSAYVDATQAETGALFVQGEIVLAAANRGFKVKDVVRHCASLTRRQSRTVFSRYAVAKTFPPDKRDMELDWFIHSLCAATDSPYQWLAIAQDGYVDERGNHKGHTSRTLKAAIKAAGGNPDKGKAVILLDGEPCTLQRINKVWIYSNTEEAVFNLTEKQAAHLRGLPYGTPLQITVVVQALASEMEAVA